MFSSSEVSDWRSEGNALFYGSGVTVMGDKLVSNCNAMTEMTPALAVIVSRPLMTPPWTEGINWDTNVAICWPAVTSIVTSLNVRGPAVRRFPPPQIADANQLPCLAAPSNSQPPC